MKLSNKRLSKKTVIFVDVLLGWLYLSAHLLAPYPVYAQLGSNIGNPAKLDIVFKFIDTILDKIVPLIGLVAFAMMIYGGFMWMASSGNPEKIKQAQGVLTWTVIGFVFLYMMSLVIKSIFGFFFTQV